MSGGVPEVLHFFTPAEAAVVATIAEQIFPATSDGPGALDAGVVGFIDMQLAGAWGRGDRMYRQGPFVQPDHVGHGWQSAMAPGDAYRYGLAALEAHVRAGGARSYTELSAEQQHETLTALSEGSIATFEAIGSQAFFALIRQNVLEGLFSDPMYGGNRDLAGWRWLGFPGDPDAYGAPYRDEVTPGKPYEVEPRALP
jgi:gluconate 2-dehydrogenase gamma chain